METWEMEAEAEPADEQSAQSNQPPKSKKRKRKQPQHSADIVFSKGYSVITMPSLSKALKVVTDAVIGLQYIWEYRSPSKAVQPHYQCKLCSLSYTQHDIIAHVRSWKHSFRYLKKAHPDKVAFDEKDGVENMEVRVAIRAAAVDVEKAEGRGQIRVILKEPYLVAAFQKLNSAFPKVAPPPDQGMGPMGPFDSAYPKSAPPPDRGMGPMDPFGPRSHDSRFPGEFPHHGRPLPDFPTGEYEESGYGSYMSTPAFPDRGNGPGPLSDSIGPGRNGYGRGGAMVEGSNTVFPKEYQENFKDRPVSTPNDRPGLLGAAPQSNNAPALLKYLETFQIENENDAQLVLKVTKKLTDALMEYRLRNIPAASTFISPSMMPTNLSNVPQRLQGDRYSSNPSGPSRYPDGPQRYFN